MVSSSYTPGTWLGVVRAGTAVLLPPATPPALVDSLWELLGGEPEVHEVLHAVTSASSGSLAQIPWFGIVDFRESLRVFLRGDIELTAHLAAGEVELNGSDVTTWTERRLSEPEWYTVSVAGDGAGAAELPLGEGVVLLQSLTAGRVPGDRPSRPASPVIEVPVTELPAPREQDSVRLPVMLPVEIPASEPVPDVPVEAVPVEDVPVEAVAAESGASAEHGASAETVMGIPDEDFENADDEATVLPDDTGSDDSGSDEAGADEAGSDVPGADVPGAAAPAESQDPVPANELTGSYDHLWEKTVVRRIEDAAVRDEPEDEPSVADAAAVAAEADSPEETVDGVGDQQPAAAQEQQQPAPVQPLIPAGQGGLIDSVPWHTGGDKPARPSGPPSFVPAASGVGSHDIPDRGSPAALPPALEGDHDGQTIMKSDLAGLGTAPQVQAPAGGNEPATGPMVLARVCPQGHANPPTHSQCAGCGMALASDAVQVRRPRLGRVRVSTGELIDLDQSLVIGRQPSVSRVQGGGMPRLVQVASPSGDISRSHVEVRLEGWHVMLCDLKATNGTVLVREGQPPRRLAQNEMAILLDGDIAELGDDVSLRFEEIL
ncbi:FHA domain-containing protein [Arthrobacter sp. LjRoot14]|uniref:FHA domain-containing protein n=1 Tax=Arthrobacter sp. LjRoot14 TaxID=3342265 RepID=UPI003ED0ABFE